MSSSSCHNASLKASFRRWARASLITVLLFLGAISFGPSAAFAQSGSMETDSDLDGRLEGYATKVGDEKDSTTGLWFIYFFLVVVGCSALFKTAKRE